MIKHLLINAAIILGIWELFTPGMIFNPVKVWIFNQFKILEKDRVKYLKPVFLCPPCMSSIYGTVYYFTAVKEGAFFYPVYLIALVGVLSLISEIINYLNR